ncbi:leucine-rich repeat domain-containing protein [Capnocytophaga canimorsus]|uniref:leucine-rich repeat domain-containing protein n=1 Tax=Capnocytophaga canimorsus TaxID=28188 RepID=UPI0037D29374
MKKFFYPLVAIFMLVAFALWGCKKEEEKNIENPLNKEEFKGIIEIPQGSDLKKSDIEIYKDGEKTEINSEGKFKSGGETFMATNKENKIVYLNYSATKSVQEGKEVVLNATETAVSMLLTVFPNIFRFSEENFQSLRKLIRDVPETKVLAQAIEKSIIKNKYLKIEEVDKEYQDAIDKIHLLSGIKRPSSDRPSVKREPKTPNIPNNQYRGVRLDINETKYIPKTNSWECNITAYSDRLAYTALLVAQKESNGLVQNYSKEYEDQMRYIVPPMSSSKFLNVFTSWQGISNYFSDTKRLFFEKGFGLGDITFDKEKLENVVLNFENTNDVIMVLSPKDSEYLMIYNISIMVVEPFIKSLGVKFDDKSAIKAFFKEFVFDMMIDTAFRNELTLVLKNSSINTLSKYKTLATKILNRLTDEIKSGVKDYIKELIIDLLKQNKVIGSLLTNIENVNAINRIATTSMDLLGGAFGITQEESFYFDMELDFFNLNVQSEQISIKVGETQTVGITGGSEVIKVDLDDQNIATVTISGNKDKLFIKGNTSGVLNITITDVKTNQTKKVVVTVMPQVLDGVVIENGVLKKWPCDKIPADGHVVIPDGVVSIGKFAFERCTSLVSVIIPEGTLSIDNDAFTQCYNLKTVNFPKTLTSIGNSAFWNCHKLASVNLPNSLKRIGNSAFNGCQSLTNITIPVSVTDFIGSSTFYGTTKLEYIHCKSPIPPKFTPLNGNPTNLGYTGKLFVPVGTKELYEKAPHWKDCNPIIEKD